MPHQPSDMQDDATGTVPSDAGASLAALVARAERAGKGAPPVERWEPEFCGDIDMVIHADGHWSYNGSPIGRPALVRLFSTVLRKDPDGYWLGTPVEKMKITVEDAPFIATGLDVAAGSDGSPVLAFTTNVGDVVEAGPENALRIEIDPATQEPRPYLHVRRGLEALISRPVFYQLVEMAQERDGVLGVESAGTWFPLGRLEAPVS